MNKKISELPPATLPLSGAELLEIVQGGINKQVAKSDVATGGGGTVTSVSGTTNRIISTGGATPVINIDPAYDAAVIASITSALRTTRTVTGASSAVQSDDNSLIILNSATPFNFTLDQLTASSKISFLNIGAGDVTMVPGSGVTISGSLVIDGAVGNLFPAAMVFYHTATTPRVFYGASDTIDLSTVSTAGGTITLDYALKQQRVFEGSASFGTAKAIVEDNETNARAGEASFNLTNIAAVLTFPSDFAMPIADSRWNNGAKTFTPETTGIHVFTWIKYSSYTAMLVPNVFP